MGCGDGARAVNARPPAHRVEHAEALEFLRSLPDSSVGLVLTDPPYFRVKPHGWDRQWSRVSGFLDWLDAVAEEWARVLRPAGTLVCFAGGNPAPGATTAARVEVKLAERFNVVASCVWVKSSSAKGNGTHSKHCRSKLRAHVPQTERAIICEHYSADNIAKGEAGYVRACDRLRGSVFEPLRTYLNTERERAGVTPGECDAATGTRMAGHWFTSSQWSLPTRKHYETLRALFNASGGEFLRREYEDLRREYEDLRRPFNSEDGQHFTDVWTYQTVQARPGKHPCEKPSEMADDLVRQCSRPGDVVLDTFCGSGVFLASAARLGRVAWGCDFQQGWACAAAREVAGSWGASRAPRRVAQDVRQMSLFGSAA